MPQLSSPRAGGDGPVRPGSMTAVMRAMIVAPTGPRWMRYAIVVDGRIIEERVVSPRTTVTVGRSENADVPSNDVEGSRKLFVYKGGAWIVRYARAWTGRMSTGRLEDRDDAEGKDGFREMRLDERARGRIQMDGTTVLVQLVDRPPVRTKPALPASVVGGVLGGVMEGADWWFTAFVASSFMVHFAVIAFVLEADWQIEQSLIPARHAVVLFDDFIPPPEDPPEIDRQGDEVVAEVDEVPSPEDGDASDGSSETGPRPRVARNDRISDPALEMAEALEAIEGVHLLLGGLLAEEGALTNTLENGAVTSEQRRALDEIGVTAVAMNGDPAIMAQRGSAPRSHSTRGLEGLDRGLRGFAREGRDADEGDGGGERVITTTVIPPDFQDLEPEGDPMWDPRELHRLLQRRMGRVRNCYEREITRGDPNLAGRVRLSMRVMPVGTLSNVHAVENTTRSSSLAQCTINAVRSVRVRQGPETPVEVRYPLVFARQDN